MSRPLAVFDIDGTLVDSRASIHRAEEVQNPQSPSNTSTVSFWPGKRRTPPAGPAVHTIQLQA